jgi:hypothetical protein
MAIKLVKTIQGYIGTAAERIAMNTTSVFAGSTFEESDTGLKYKWDGSAWFTSSEESLTLAAGTNVVGKFGIDQSTPGTTNGISGTRKNDSSDTAAGQFHMTIGGSDGTNLRPLLLDALGKILLGAGTNVIGKVGMQVGGADLDGAHQLPTNVTELEVSCVITRAANTTQYTQNAIINGNGASVLPELDFSTAYGSSLAGRKIQINSIMINSDYGAASTKLVPEVILYNANTLTGQTLTDNTAFNPTAAQHILKKAASFSKQENWQLGDFAYGNFYEMRLTEIVRNATLDANGKLYPSVIATNAYTPKSGEVITLTVKAYVLN